MPADVGEAAEDFVVSGTDKNDCGALLVAVGVECLMRKSINRATVQQLKLHIIPQKITQSILNNGTFDDF